MLGDPCPIRVCDYDDGPRANCPMSMSIVSDAEFGLSPPTKGKLNRDYGCDSSLATRNRDSLDRLSSQVIFNCDLTPARPAMLGSRQQRRATSKQAQIPDLSPTQIDAQVSRTLDYGQLGVEITNNATFPISCFLEFADTEIEGFRPPRSKYPKASAMIAPGEKLRFSDDRMDMEKWPCQKLSGTGHFVLRYGLQGKEQFRLELDGAVVVVMEHFGFTSQIHFSPKSSTSLPTTAS